MGKDGKTQRVVKGTLAVMVVASFLLAAASFVALPAAQAAPPQPRDPCAYWDCYSFTCYCCVPIRGDCPWGCTSWCTRCCYSPYPSACYRCPGDCCWCSCYCPEYGWGECWI